MNATQAAETTAGNTDTLEVRQLDAAVVAHHHIFDVSFAIDQSADLAPRLMGQLGDLLRSKSRYPEAVEEFPWGHYAFKVKGKSFCFMGKGEPEISLSCKLPQSRDAALGFDWAEPTHYGLGKSGWVTATFAANAKVPVDLLMDWMEESYRAIAPKKSVTLSTIHT